MVALRAPPGRRRGRRASGQLPRCARRCRPPCRCSGVDHWGGGLRCHHQGVDGAVGVPESKKIQHWGGGLQRHHQGVDEGPLVPPFRRLLTPSGKMIRLPRECPTRARARSAQFEQMRQVRRQPHAGAGVRVFRVADSATLSSAPRARGRERNGNNFRCVALVGPTRARARGPDFLFPKWD